MNSAKRTPAESPVDVVHRPARPDARLHHVPDPFAPGESLISAASHLLTAAELQEHRDAILRRLHDERRALVSRRAVAGITPNEASFLADIEAEIDHLELEEEHHLEQRHHATADRLEALAQRVLALYSNEPILP